MGRFAMHCVYDISSHPHGRTYRAVAFFAAAAARSPASCGGLAGREAPGLTAGRQGCRFTISARSRSCHYSRLEKNTPAMRRRGQKQGEQPENSRDGNRPGKETEQMSPATNGKKRGFGLLEAAFDLFYLICAMGIGIWLLAGAQGSPAAYTAGAMALVLSGGDAFHLLPRVALIFRESRGGAEDDGRLRRALGRGKFITSLTMTAFYLLAWRLGTLLFPAAYAEALSWAMYLLAAGRIVLCLLPRNRWAADEPDGRWGLIRNLPFFIMGVLVAVFFGVQAVGVPWLQWVWLAVTLSFACYVPVVVGADRHPMLGMLMLPKTCAYLWLLALCACALGK